MGTGSFPGVKRPGRGADHRPPSNCRGHERVELYLYSPSGPSWPVKGRTFTFTLNTVDIKLRNGTDARLTGTDMHYFTTKQISMTKLLVACNPFLCQTYRIWERASMSDASLCSAAKKWSSIFDHLYDCVCVYLDTKLHQSVTRHCSLLHLQRFITATYRFTLASDTAGMR